MARGPQIHQMVKATITLAAAALLLQLAPGVALGSENGTTTSNDRFAAGSMANRVTNGTTTSNDSFAAGSASQSVDTEFATDGWANRSTPAISRDGWEVARLKLPEPATVTDGWAFRSDTSGVDLASLDGWAYGTVNTPISSVEPAPAPPRQTSPPFAEIALAVSLALLAAAGGVFFHHRHQHHLPV